MAINLPARPDDPRILTIQILSRFFVFWVLTFALVIVLGIIALSLKITNAERSQLFKSLAFWLTMGGFLALVIAFIINIPWKWREVERAHLVLTLIYGGLDLLVLLLFGLSVTPEWLVNKSQGMSGWWILVMILAVIALWHLLLGLKQLIKIISAKGYEQFIKLLGDILREALSSQNGGGNGDRPPES